MPISEFPTLDTPEAEKNSHKADGTQPSTEEQQTTHEQVPQETPPPPPKSIFDVIYEEKNVNVPTSRIASDIQDLISQSGLDEQYDFIFLYDEGTSISRFTSNRLYSAATGPSHDPQKGIFLLLHTNGGRVEPAYLISKCCKRSAPKFVVAVPRFAKSAGTLIALGADEIHMGIISELGPVDPQIGEYPALGLGSAIDHIAKLCKKHPESTEMLAKYLASSLNLHDLGYYERVSESAAQYAERLLSTKKLAADQSAASVAQHFVYGYKDHGFVIDHEEAKRFLGDLIKTGTPEYRLANEIHEYMEGVNLAYGAFRSHYCRIVGNLQRGITVWEKKD
jgi:hypothetical protein